jgi:hypothetical protein
MHHKRTFTIHDAMHSDGCQTKFSNKHYTGVYVSSSPSGAAKKALSQLCRVKNIHGQCTLYIVIRETTQGSAKKHFSYKLNRVKLSPPLLLKGREIHYTSKCKSVDSIPKCKVGSRKSSGRKRSSHKSHQGKSGSRSRSRSRSRR